LALGFPSDAVNTGVRVYGANQTEIIVDFCEVRAKLIAQGFSAAHIDACYKSLPAFTRSNGVSDSDMPIPPSKRRYVFFLETSRSICEMGFSFEQARLSLSSTFLSSVVDKKDDNDNQDEVLALWREAAMEHIMTL
jgi:hypothetical protein